MADKDRVLMIYTGGTIGMLPQRLDEPASPLVPAQWQAMEDFAPALKRLSVGVDLRQMDPVDSSDMRPGNWLNIARLIGREYDNYQGFVVLHGTDTMSYTASALSFLLEGLAKPVILTGSQVPLSQPRTDAVQNMVTALMIAASGTFGLPLVPEVTICFNNLLLRGNRARKLSSSAYSGFSSPNYPVLGTAGSRIRLDQKAIRARSEGELTVHHRLEENVLAFDIFPGLTPVRLRQILSLAGLRGVILRTYGSGNAPTDPEFLEQIEAAISDRGLSVVNISQCPQGRVDMGRYRSSEGLSRIGVIGGGDMTPEAALTKMMFLLGRSDDHLEVGQWMQLDLRGELTTG